MVTLTKLATEVIAESPYVSVRDTQAIPTAAQLTAGLVADLCRRITRLKQEWQMIRPTHGGIK
jgi:hypothetical protein